jgi:prephenate dehydratase
VLAAVRDGSADLGCVPIENSVEGAVPAVLDGLVADPPLVIVREAVLAVRFALLARRGTRIDDVRTVASHPHGIAQTRAWIAAQLPNATVLTSASTSEAAAQVARGEFDAAVSAPLAAEQHGLEILADDIADNAGAVTRFALVSPPCPPPAPTGHDRTSLAATTQNRPGALLGLLTELAVRGIDLTRIESRPIKDRHAEYWFHLDCTGHVAEPAMGEALAALHRRSDRVRFLGSYPRAGNGASEVAPSTSPFAIGATDAAQFEAAQKWLDALRSGGTA